MSTRSTRKTRHSSSNGRVEGRPTSSNFVSKSRNVWQTHLIAKTYSVRPSELLGLEPRSLEAYCLDEAVATFGNALSAELEGVEGKTAAAIEARRNQILEQWLETSVSDEDIEVPKGHFADPAGLNR